MATIIDYKKLLKRCMEHWINSEGGCWNGYEGDDQIDKLSPKESKAINDIYKELV